MSEAKAAAQSALSLAACSQCQQRIPSTEALRSRHAVPCGHVFCWDCANRTESEQKSGKVACRSAGCLRDLAPVASFPTATCTQREYRLLGKLDEVLADQGNVGDRPPNDAQSLACVECEPDPVTEKPHAATHECQTCGNGAYFCSKMASVHPDMRATRGHVVVSLPVPAAADAASGVTANSWSLCPAHKLPYKRVDAANTRMMCTDCLASATGSVALQSLPEALLSLESKHAACVAEAARQKDILAEFTVPPDAYFEGVNKWCAHETTRIKAWELREVRHVQAVAARCTALVKEVCARRLEVGASLLAQRYGLRASLEELEHGLANRPADEAERLAKTLLLTAERQKLVELLAEGGISIPGSIGLKQWIVLPTLDGQFGVVEAGQTATGTLAEATSTAARALLGECRDAIPAIGDPSGLHFMPRLVCFARLKCLSIGTLGSVPRFSNSIHCYIRMPDLPSCRTDHAARDRSRSG